MNSLLDGPPERIAVFRALMLGDLLCSVPALRALKCAFPDAELTLVGLPWARAWSQRVPWIDGFVEFPGHPALPEREADVRALPDFLAQMQAKRFDLAVQLHGSGEISNPIVASFGARQSAGFASPHAWRPEDDEALFVPWPEHGHEIERLLAVTDRLGAPRRGTQLEFPITAEDRDALREAWPGVARRQPYVCVHAGAQLASRRWDPRRFAEVADGLAERGRTIVLTGSAVETGLVADLAACMRHPSVDLSGATSLWTLGALIEGAEAVVCNDTGISHIAAALGTPSVVVSCGADTSRWAPLDGERHRVLAHEVACRPCAFAECPTLHECARGVEVPRVLHAAPVGAMARAALSAPPRRIEQVHQAALGRIQAGMTSS